jgi:hypothetical protein
MVKLTIRIEEELAEKLTKRAGKGNVNGFVVDLIEAALGLHEALERSPEGVTVTQELVEELPVIDATEALPATGRLPGPDALVPARACGYWLGAEWCHRPAVRFEGTVPRCEQH